MITFMTLLVMSAMACGVSSIAPRPVEKITEADLVGIWESDYANKSGVEILVIKNDGTYQQFFQDSAGYFYTGESNQWYLDLLKSRRLFIHFEKGRYFPAGVRFADLLGADPLDHARLYGFYDSTDGASIYMDNELLLEVQSRENSKALLWQFAADIDSSQEHFYQVKP